MSATFDKSIRTDTQSHYLSRGLWMSFNPCAAFNSRDLESHDLESHNPKVHNVPSLCCDNFTQYKNVVKLSQYNSGSQWLMGQNDPKITQGLNPSRLLKRCCGPKAWLLSIPYICSEGGLHLSRTSDSRTSLYINWEGISTSVEVEQKFFP